MSLKESWLFSLFSILSDLYEEKQRGWVIGFFYMAIPVGGALGYILGGRLGWPDSFFWVVPPGLLMAIWCWFLPDPSLNEASLKGESSLSGVKAKSTWADYLLPVHCTFCTWAFTPLIFHEKSTWTGSLINTQKMVYEHVSSLITNSYIVLCYFYEYLTW